MSKKLFLISFVLAFALLGSISQAQENQIINGEFDNDLISWGSYGGAGFTFEVVPGAGLSGNYAVVLDVTDASAGTAIGISQAGLVIEPGVTYPIGFMAKAEQDREMVVLLQASVNGSWPTYVNETVQLTTTKQTYLVEYTHTGDTIGDEAGEILTLYLMLKGTWWPMTGDDLNAKVWFDWVYFGAQPKVQERGRAVNPTPDDGAIHEDTWVNLRWFPGDFAVSHDVYLGENFDEVNDGTEGTFVGNQPAPDLVIGFPGFPYPDGLVPGTTYYWRIDEVNETDPNSPWKGDVWSFTVPPRIAYAPSPPDTAKFVDPEVVLSWGAGFGSKLHTIYFGDNFDDVNNAAVGLPQAETTYTPGTLELEKTYYWRVDEFSGADTFKGDVWSFIVTKAGGGLKAEYFNNRDLSGEPVLTRIDPEIDFNWGNADVPGENSPDASINVDDFSARWSGELEVDLTDTYTFHVTANNGFRLWLDGELIIDYWNNLTTDSRESEPIELVAGDIHSVQMEYFEGADTAVAQLFWESTKRQQHIIPSGALQLPLKASAPNPSNRAVDVKQTQIISWSAVEDAASHQVYFGTDEEAVKNADTSSPEYKGSKTLGSESYDPGLLQWNTTYYWRVDEVKTDGTVQMGNIWSFSTANFLVIDDMESYNDLDPADPASNRIFNVWLDGFDNPATNGSIVGHGNPPFAEQTIVHGGSQSMPFVYDNVVGKSETTLTLTDTRDWTVNGINTLTIWFRGEASNAAETMYVVINGSAGVDNDNPDAAQIDEWTRWDIDLQSFGINLANVTSITLGLRSVTGGAGIMYFDDIRLYALQP
ncbi:MAG: hypothetical protein GY774_37825 [Planctomycetes bacterium]|nr:hypothetical protein [Planctomycetota bacterium]